MVSRGREGVIGEERVLLIADPAFEFQSQVFNFIIVIFIILKMISTS